jgi:hypothetical protein
MRETVIRLNIPEGSPHECFGGSATTAGPLSSNSSPRKKASERLESLRYR